MIRQRGTLAGNPFVGEHGFKHRASVKSLCVFRKAPLRQGYKPSDKRTNAAGFYSMIERVVSKLMMEVEVEVAPNSAQVAG